MKELNYQPNEMARSLSKKTSNTIGVIVPHIMHPYFSKLISNLERAAYENDYRILLFNSKGKEEKEEEYIEMCKSNRVAGVIVCSGSVKTAQFRNLNFPMVTLERTMDEGTAGIECDNRQGGILAAEHLISRGCRHILFLGGKNEKNPMPGDDRGLGCSEVCSRQGAGYVEVNAEESVYTDLSYYGVIRDALQKYPETDGIFASSDLIAAQALQVCSELGLAVPDRMKIVGFDDEFIASLTTPGITTIRQPVKEMADTAVSLLVRSGSGSMVPAKSVFPVSLVVRGTT